MQFKKTIESDTKSILQIAHIINLLLSKKINKYLVKTS